MRLLNLRRGLWLVGTAFSLSGVLALLWALFWPCPAPEFAASVRRTGADTSKSVRQEDALPPFKAFEPHWQQRLRRPLVDPPPTMVVPATPVARSAPPLQLRLLGTILEAGRSMAMLTTPAGAIELRGVGESIGDPPADAQVIEIGLKKVVLRYRGEVVTLELQEVKGI